MITVIKGVVTVTIVSVGVGVGVGVESVFKVLVVVPMER